MRPASDVRDTDNRPLEEIASYQADRINALRRYINELEEENAKLRRNVMNAHLGAVEAA